MNDGFCDCCDGSDEPGTGACAHLMGSNIIDAAFFHCTDASATLHPSFVDDGVCDCADHSDEEGTCTEARKNGATNFGTIQPPALTRLAQLGTGSRG